MAIDKRLWRWRILVGVAILIILPWIVLQFFPPMNIANFSVGSLYFSCSVGTTFGFSFGGVQSNLSAAAVMDPYIKLGYLEIYVSKKE